MQPPEQTPIRFGETRLATGVRLHYAEAGTPGGTPVLLLHGYSDSWLSFSTVLPLLPPAVRAFALSQRGHGQSEQPPCCYEIEDLAADAAAFLDAMGVARATVVGHSMGSFVAQRMALDHPGRVERLVLVGSSTMPANDGVLEFADAVASLTDPVPAQFLREFQMSTLYQPIPEALLDAFVAESARLPARVWRALMAGMLNEDFGPSLHRIRVPTLLLWGEHDVIFSRVEQERLQAGIPGARLKVYPETGHALHWERPQAFADDLLAFIGAAAVPAR